MATSKETLCNYLFLVFLFQLCQELKAERCFTTPGRWTYCSRRCCPSYSIYSKCCSNVSTYLSVGTVVGTVISSLVAFGVIVTLIICFACSKAKRGRIIRAGPVMQSGVTVVNSSTISGPSTIHCGPQYRPHYNPAMGPTGHQPYNYPPIPQPHQNMHGAPPSYPGLPPHQPLNQGPPSNLYDNSLPPPPSYNTISVVNPAYPPQYNGTNTIHVAPNPVS